MNGFNYTDEKFADIQMLRYRLNGFSQLSLKQKTLIYYLSQATLAGRDITFDQHCKHNLKIRAVLEAIIQNNGNACMSDNMQALHVYLKRVWFSSGIHHHYGCEKFEPGFSEAFFRECLDTLTPAQLPLDTGQTRQELCEELARVIFNPEVYAKLVNQHDGDDLVMTSACNFYEGVTQQEAEDFYNNAKANDGDKPLSHGLNSQLAKSAGGTIAERQWRKGGMYGPQIENIIYWLKKAEGVAENSKQQDIISLLISYYETGSLATFNDYCIEWVKEHDAKVDFINGFIEVYGDPLGYKGSWEGLVEYRDEEATQRTRTISANAQWFEDHSPVNPLFKKAEVKGVTANVICAAMLGGDEYPATAIGINLPNADWIRREHGSKSITISNITEAYNEAAKGGGFINEFAVNDETKALIDSYADVCDNLHTDLHECLGHGSGQLLPGTSASALKEHGNTIEEARADLFALYYIADRKMVELQLLPNMEAYKASYYTYMMNGLMTQAVRIKPGAQIEEAHMRNRALIAGWCHEHGKADNVIDMVRRDGKTFVKINDYDALRKLIAELLAEIQRIKSEGDYAAAKTLVETYAININPTLHAEVLERYKGLNLAPYKGFINPRLIPVYGDNGEITDVTADYTEGYNEQMMRYGREFK